MKFTIEMVAARLPDLLAASRRERLPRAPARIALAPLPGAHRPAYDDTRWDLLRIGDRWGGSGLTYWLRIPLRIPDAWADQPAVVHIALGDYDNITGPEALAYLDGEPIQAFDFHHKDLLISDRLRPSADHLLALEAYSSLMQSQQTLRALELVRLDAEAEALYHDIRVLHGALLTMHAGSLDRARLLRILERAYQALDLRNPQSDAYLQSVPRARAILREAYRHFDAAGQPRTVAVGHAHIDLAWLWPVAQTRRKGARTFTTVLKLMEQYPSYHFVASQPALYQMIQQDEPALYARIKQRIAEGRWEPTGAAWVEMDCNLAGGEALVRQFLLGQRFFRDELGVETRLLWLPDVFGYSAALPQILKGCGVDYFMTTKISWNEYNRLPYDTFRWRGIDGTEVLTHMVTAPLNPHELSGSTMPQTYYTYNAKFTPYDVAGNWSTYRQKDINDELLYLFGYGDGGGGPTAQMQETAARLAHLPGFPRVEQSSAEQFFRRLERRVWSDPSLPTWVGELYLEYHRGTYTSQAWIKRANRLNELLYREAELWSALAATAATAATAETTQAQPTIAAWQADLAQGWQTLLFNQFHDILPGSSINQVYVDARADHREVAARGERVRDAALDSVCASLTGQHASAAPALLVFNPAPFDRIDPVELTLPAGATLPALTDAAGQPILTQEIDRDATGQTRLLVAAPAPALGYRAFTAITDASDPSPSAVVLAPAPASDLTITRNLLENRFFRLTLDERGHITSLYDKRASREVIADGGLGNQFLAFEDRPLNFDAWDINIYYQDKPYAVDDLTSLRVVEVGPLRGGVEIVRPYGSSTITQRILLHRDVPRIDFPTNIDWHEQQTLLKAAFPVTVNSPRATFDIQWGNVERPTHWNTSWDWARFETCAHKWADLSEGDYGVSLLNDCKYGHDISGNVIRLTLIKCPISPDPQADQGEHIFSYSLLPHQGDWRMGETVRHAYLFNMPARARLTPAAHDSPAQSPTHGALPAEASCVSTDRPGLVIETVKPAEDGDGIIVRLYDAHNTRGPAVLRFFRPIASAEETNMLEERIGPADIAGHKLRLSVRPYGISTFRVRLV